MIRVTIREIAARNNVNTPAELSRSIGVTKPTAARLWEGKLLVGLATLNKMCEAWKCDLSDLVQYVPDKPTRNGKRKRS